MTGDSISSQRELPMSQASKANTFEQFEFKLASERS